MALPININDLLNGKPVEWERLEFKAGWNPEAVLHTLCAFANDIHNLGGGYILIGIQEENGRPVLPPVGIYVAQIDAIQKELLNLGFNAIALLPSHRRAGGNRGDVLVLWALGGPTRPYKAKICLGKDSKDYAYYIRKNSTHRKRRTRIFIRLFRACLDARVSGNNLSARHVIIASAGCCRWERCDDCATRSAARPG